MPAPFRLARLALAFVAAAAASALLAADDWAPNLTTTAAWHDNATQAVASADRLDSLQLNADLLSAKDYALGRAGTLRLTAHLGGDWWPHYRKLLSGAAGGRADWSHALGTGALAPLFSVEAGADAIYASERARAGTASAVTVALRKRLNDRVRVLVQHELSRHDARHAVYDRTGSETTAELGYDPSPRSRLTLGARYRSGDVVSYAATPSAELASVTRVAEVTNTFDRPLVASSLDARTWAGRVAWLRAFDDASAVVAAYELRSSRAAPVRFRDHVISVALVHQF